MKILAAFTILCVLAATAGPARAGDEDKSKDSKDAPDKTQNFVFLKPVMLPVLASNGGIDQFISVTITLEFDDAATADKERAIAPRIVDAYLQDLYGAVDDHRVMRHGVLDPTALKAELDSSNSRVLQGVPCHVLLQNIGQRSLHESSSS